MRVITLVFILCFYFNESSGQGCCSGSSGNPIAGGVSSGVLQENQIEFSSNYQYTFSDKFFSGTQDTINLFDNLNSDYLFLKTEYGVNKRITLSISAGYYFNKAQVGGIKPTKSNGLADIIIFPRINVLNKDMPFNRTEITLGVGVKAPLGTHKDSSLIIPSINYWEINPPITQLSSGAYDLLLYSFFLREFKLQKIKIFSSILHINKGFNSLDQKMGNYSSFAIYISKILDNNIGSALQIKAEEIKKMDAGNVWNSEDLEASSGSNKIFLIPQLSYSLNNFSFFGSYEIPLYQNINGTQIGSKEKITFGFSYRFLTKKKINLE
ncbi:MAG: hypothetical protein ACKVLD_01875 [Flavobacteriales bacterium]|jgi:hypothetical protein|tara:strand:- start:9663 stop:10634 length:972 start_codon:yes stop_codon:yes gene_type:complete